MKKFLCCVLALFCLVTLCAACTPQEPEPEPDPDPIVEPDPEPDPDAEPELIDRSNELITEMAMLSESEQTERYNSYFEQETLFGKEWNSFKYGENTYHNSIYDNYKKFSCRQLEGEEANILIWNGEEVNAWGGAGGYLYCAVGSSRIIRMDYDGRNKELVWEEESGGITELFVNDDGLMYFLMGKEVYRLLIGTELLEHVYTIPSPYYEPSVTHSFFVPVSNKSFVWAEPADPDEWYGTGSNVKLGDPVFVLHLYDLENGREVNLKQFYIVAIANQSRYNEIRIYI